MTSSRLIKLDELPKPEKAVGPDADGTFLHAMAEAVTAANSPGAIDPALRRIECIPKTSRAEP